MWFIAMKRLPGCGKSAVSRALGKQLGCPVIDKDDIKDILEWSRRINGRKQLQLPPHHQTDWDTLQTSRAKMEHMMDYPISGPRITVDTVRPLDEIIAEIMHWLSQLSEFGIHEIV